MADSPKKVTTSPARRRLPGVAAASKPPQEKQASNPSDQPAVNPLRQAKVPEHGKARAYAAGLVAVIKKQLPDKADPDAVRLLSQGDILSAVTEWIPSMFPNVDSVIGGGWAVGRVSEIFGPEGSGKSALTHMAIKGCQTLGGVPIVLDFEAALEPHKLEQLGIDPARLIYIVPEHVEQGLNILTSALEQMKAKAPPAPVLIVWDSVAAAPTSQELVKQYGDKTMMVKAQLMSEACRKLLLLTAKTRAHVMFVNQEREGQPKPGSFFKEMETPGGKGVRYAASQRIRCTRVSTLKESRGGQPRAVGYLTQIVTRKCRLTPPHQKTTFVLDFMQGPSPELTMRQLMLDAKVMQTVKTPKGTMLRVKVDGDAYDIPRSQWLRHIQTDANYRALVEKAYQPVLAKVNWVNMAADDVDVADGKADTSEEAEGQE